MNEHIYAAMPDGSRIQPIWDPRQVGDSRLSSVQYLAFVFGPEPPLAIGIKMGSLEAETALSDAQREALREDLTTE